MKLMKLLIVTAWCSMIAAHSETTDVDREALLKRAADQLDRLMPYRKNAENRSAGDQSAEIDLMDLLETWRLGIADQNHVDEAKGDAEAKDVPWEMLELFPEQTGSDEAAKRAGDEEVITIDLLTDPKHAAMQDRIKRGFNAGSGSLVASIAGGILSGVASASSSSAGKASAGSSSSSSEYKPSYAAPSVEHSYSYGEKHFGPWEFKKAIFSTLFQALKAIGGGVLALKGQLVKGGGYLLAAKGKAFGKTGDVITSFGKHLAASALTEPKPHLPETYYDHPPSTGHDSGYEGLPPHSDDYPEANGYIHETYGLPSDNNGQGGLLIVTPTKSDPDEHSDQYTDVQKKPDQLAALEESFGGPSKGVIANLLSGVPKGSAHASGTKDQPIANQDSSNVDLYPAIQHPAPPLGALDHYTTNHNDPVQNYEGNYQLSGQDVYQPQLPPQTVALSHHHRFPNLDDPNLIQPNAEYSPLLLQQIQHSPKLPHNDGGTSVFSSLSVDTEPQIAPLKVPFSDAFNLPKLQTHVDFHEQPHFANQIRGSLDGPLRIPLLNSKPADYYWQTQDSFAPATFNMFNQFQKRNALHRRMFAKRLARYSSLQRLHRV